MNKKANKTEEEQYALPSKKVFTAYQAQGVRLSPHFAPDLSLS